MKNKRIFLMACLLVLTLLFSLSSCAKEPAETTEKEKSFVTVSDTAETAGAKGASVPAEGVWKDATYREDKEFGNGEKTVLVEVKAENQSITFTLHSDKENLADALLEYDLVEGEDSQYGLYIKKVNGILADYDKDGSYWSFTKNGEMMMSGASSTEFSDGEHYEFVRTK